MAEANAGVAALPVCPLVYCSLAAAVWVLLGASWVSVKNAWSTVREPMQRFHKKQSYSKVVMIGRGPTKSGVSAAVWRMPAHRTATLPTEPPLRSTLFALVM